MANIDAGPISEAEFKKMDLKDQNWILYRAHVNTQGRCTARPAECEKKFVKARHVVYASIAVMAFLAGLGVYQANVILPKLITKAMTTLIIP